VTPGFNLSDVQVVSADLQLHDYDSAHAKAFQQALSTRLQRCPV